MTRSVLLAAAPLLLAVLAASPALSQTAAPVATTACASCHGPAGISGSPAIPNLAGQKAGYLEGQLKAFRAKSRTNAFMSPIAAQLGDDDIHTLALYCGPPCPRRHRRPRPRARRSPRRRPCRPASPPALSSTRTSPRPTAARPGATPTPWR